MNMTRQPYLDRIRWSTVLVVVVYHVLYQFNSVGLIRNVHAPGLPLLDTPMAFVYPWFMGLLFVAAGMSARYSLQKRTGNGIFERPGQTYFAAIYRRDIPGQLGGGLDHVQRAVFHFARQHGTARSRALSHLLSVRHRAAVVLP